MAGIPEDHLHREYFSVPEQPDYENFAFELLLAKSGKRISVQEDETASDALIANGYPVDVKCSDGLCGVCQCGVLSGDIEHRDFVLSAAQRESQIILCQSRAAAKTGSSNSIYGRAIGRLGWRFRILRRPDNRFARRMLI